MGLARAGARRERLGQSPDRFEDESLAFHREVRDAFLAIAAAEPARCHVVDASGTPELIAERVWAVMAPRLTIAPSRDGEGARGEAP